MNPVLLYELGKSRGAFTFTINTSNAGSSASNQFTLPLISLGTYNATVNWGDGVISTITAYNQVLSGETVPVTHTYASSGAYTITINGICRGWSFNAAGDKLKITEIKRFGRLRYASSNPGAFDGCSNLILTNVADVPDFTGATNLTLFLRNCTSITSIARSNEWVFPAGLSNVIGFFQGDTNMNTNISNWVFPSGVISLNNFLRDCNSFNYDITNLFSSNISSIQFTLNNATVFNQNLGSANVSGVTLGTSFMLGKTAANYSASNLDAIYNGWTNRQLNTAVTIGFGTIKYTAAGTEGKALLTRTAATVAISNAVNNGSGLIRITATAHGLSTGNKCYVSGVGGVPNATGAWIVTVIDANNIDLQATLFSGSYTSGGTLRTGYGWTITDGGI